MIEFLLTSVVVLIGLAILGCLLAAPLMAAVHARQLRDLENRVKQLEEGLAQPRTAELPPETREVIVAEAVTAEPPPVAPATAAHPLRARWPAEPAERPSTALPPWPAPPELAVSSETLEAWIGRWALGWVAVGLLLLATAFFLKHIFENRWIGETGRVALGVAGGLVLCIAGLRYHRRGWNVFAQMLTGGGIVLLYLATYGAFGYYHLLPQHHAAVFLVILIAEVAALAVFYEAPAIAVVAVLGGLLNPVLLKTEVDQYRSLFLYLALLNAGVVGLAAVRPWPAMGSVGLLGSYGLFWLWHGQNYHPEKLGWALGFQAALLALYISYAGVTHLVRRRRASMEDLVRLLLAGGLFYLAAYVLLDDDYHAWMGSLALGVAVLYTVYAAAALRFRTEDQRQVLLAITAAMGFIAVAIPLQAKATWIALGWAVQGVLLWWFGCRVRLAGLRAVGVVLLLLAALRLVGATIDRPHDGPFVPLLNRYGTPAALVVVCLLGAAVIARRYAARLSQSDQFVRVGCGLAGLGLLWLVLSMETYDAFVLRAQPHSAVLARYGTQAADPTGRPLAVVTHEARQRLHRTAQTAMSIIWAVYASVVLAIGFRIRSHVLRAGALVIFGATLVKVLILDTAHLPGFYRVAALFGLAVMMGGAAWGYQKWHHARQGNPRGDLADEQL